MAEKLKNLTTYKATWDKIRKNPAPYLDEHVKFIHSSKPIKDGEGVYQIGTTARSCENFKTLIQSAKELEVQIAKIILQNFIHVEQRLPRKNEKIPCTISISSAITHHKRVGLESNIVFTGKIVPKV